MLTNLQRGRTYSLAALAASVVISSAIVGAQDLSAVVTEVLALQDRINDAAASGDGAVLEELLSENFVTNSPSNRIARRAELAAFFSSGQLAYTSIESTVDFAEQLDDDLVVVMGTETTTQSETVLHRRYTEVYRREDGVWRMLIKQSTPIPSN